MIDYSFIDNWSDKDQRIELNDGTKARQRDDIIDRAAIYKDWHRTIGKDFYCCDIDQIEYRFDGEKIKAVALLELTRIDTDSDLNISPNYLKAILDRFNRDGQSKFAIWAAKQLKTKAAIVLFNNNLSRFWVYNLSDGAGWFFLDNEKYKNWIKNLR